MKVGDIILFRKCENSLISKIIAKLTSSSFTHVGIVEYVDNDCITVAEAQAKGFVLNEYPTELVESNIICGEWTVLQSKKPLMCVEAIISQYLGKPYGYLDLVAIFLYKITGKILFKGTSKRLICSEAVTRVLYDASDKEIDFEKEFNKPYSYITPDDIFMSKQLKHA